MSDLQTTLDVLRLNVRTRNVMAAAGIKTLSDLTRLTVSDLRKRRNVGRMMINEIVTALETRGLTLKDYLVETRPQFTVVVMTSAPDAGVPNAPTMAFVIPSKVTEHTLQEFRDAAKEGGCAMRMFTVLASGIEHVKWELRTFSDTKVG